MADRNNNPSRRMAWHGMAWLLAVLPFNSIGCTPKATSLPGGFFDAGAVFRSQDPSLLHDFDVVNTTGRAVRILGISRSCGCTSVEFSAKVLKPGERNKLKVRIELPSNYTDREVSANVLTDHPTFPQWSYRIHFEAFPDVRIAPERIQLGDHRIERLVNTSNRDPWIAHGTGWVEFYLRAAKAEMPRPLEVSTPDGVEAVLSTAEMLETLESGILRLRYPLTFRVRDTCSPGSFAEPVTVTLDDGKHVSAMITWSVLAPVVITPSSMHFGMILPNPSEKKQRILIRSTDNRPFRLTSIDSDCAFLRVSDDAAHSKPRTEHMIELVLGPVESHGARSKSGILWVRSDLEGVPELPVRWSAFLAQATERSGIAAEGR